MTETYINNRKKYTRPQAVLLADAQGTVVNETFVPDGDEFTNYIILTDDNRKELDMSVDRIEQRKRMINGRMRSYHVADKLKLSLKWDMIPSRTFTDIDAAVPFTATGLENSAFDAERVAEDVIAGKQPRTDVGRITTDGGAAGVEMLDWHERFSGPFWVFLAYDKYVSLSDSLNVAQDLAFDPHIHLHKYNQRVEMYFSDFSYSVARRGPKFDYWNVNMSLEEA